jgi:hypothetical protein
MDKLFVNLIILLMMHSQLLEGFKCESKWKTTKEGGVEVVPWFATLWGVEGHVGAPGWD